MSAFLIYHHDDYQAAEAFVATYTPMFNDVYTRGVTEGDDFVDSPSDDAIIGSIQARYLRDATLAIVLLGATTWSRRFVDWEIAAALGGPSDVPLALMALALEPEAPRVPPRLTCGGEQRALAKLATMPCDPVQMASHVAAALRQRRRYGPLSPPALLQADLL